MVKPFELCILVMSACTGTAPVRREPWDLAKPDFDQFGVYSTIDWSSKTKTTGIWELFNLNELQSSSHGGLLKCSLDDLEVPLEVPPFQSSNWERKSDLDQRRLRPRPRLAGALLCGTRMAQIQESLRPGFVATSNGEQNSNFTMALSHRIHVWYIYIYVVTFTINIPPMLAYIPYMDPMALWHYGTMVVHVLLETTRVSMSFWALESTKHAPSMGEATL